MKVATTLISLGLAFTAFSEPVPAKRDLATFKSILSDISDAVTKLTTAINGYSSGSGDDVKSASANVISEIKKGVATASSQPQLSENDALQLTQPVQDLTDVVKKSIDAVIAKKSAFVSGGLGGTVKSALSDQLSSSQDLAKTISSKVPESLQGLAQQLSSGIATQIQRGVDAYKDVPTGSSTGSSTGSATGSSTGSSGPTGSSQPTGGSSPSGSSPGGSVTPAPTGGATPTPSVSGSYSMPSPSASGSPSPFPGAASVNGYNTFGLFAAVAAVLAF